VDIAKAHVKALQYLEQASDQRLYEYFNLGTGEGTSVLELINKFIKATGVDIPFVIGPRRPGDIEKVYADPTKANKQLGWSTELSMEDALKHAWEWQKVLTARGKK
jgi:UDP-glucose 4-epimerase